MRQSDLGLGHQPGPGAPSAGPAKPAEPEPDQPAPAPAQDPGRSGPGPAPNSWTPRTAGWQDDSAPRRNLLTSGAADQLAALIARSANAPAGLVHFVEGDRLRSYGGYGISVRWEDVADVSLEDTLAGILISSGRPLIIEDLGKDPRVPPGSPVHRVGMTGAYLGHPVWDDDGVVVGVCCALDSRPHRWTDDDIAAIADAAHVAKLLITEQLARLEIDRQHRFLDAVVDSLHDGVVACDADGRIVLVNARMQKLWGGPPFPRDLDELAGAGLTDPHGNPLRREDLGLFRALRGERLRDEEVVLQIREQRTRHLLVDAQPILGSDGRTVGAVQAIQDVTRRKRAERFRTCELAVVTALAAAPTVEAAGPRVLEAVVGTLGWTHAELWLVDDGAAVLRSAAIWHSPLWEADIEVPGELAYGTGLAGRAWQAGKPLWIQDVGRPQSLISPATAASSQFHTALAVPVRTGLETLGVLVAFADTIEDPEDELVALMSGISAQIAQFIERRLVEDLQRQLARSKSEYLALVGHELRTPLTSIAAYTELLRDADAEGLVKDGPRLLEVIDRNATQLRHIINELLELSALDTGHASVRLSPVDLAQIVRDAVVRTRDVVADEPVTIVDDLPEQLVLPGDRERLRQVVDNLLSNAVKYSPDGGEIAVTLRTVGRTAELAVSDTGIGVSQDEREKMFTGLYRTSRARDRAIPGSGLGLTLSRAVVQRHHGSIELTEHEGPGTTVLVRLPLGGR